MTRCVAIQWDPQTLRIAAADVADRPRIDAVANLPLDDATEPAAMTDFVSRFVAKHGLARADASVVIPRGQLELRVIEVPSAPDDELPELVRYQAKSYFSAAADGHVIDFIRLANGENTSPVQVLAAALPNADYKKLLSIFEPSKIRIRHVLPRPFALANLLQQKLQAPKHHLLINRNGAEVDLSVTYRGRIVLTRTIRVPSEPAEQAAAIASEIRRTAAAASNQPSGGPLHKVLMLGGTPAQKELAHRIEEQLQLPVEVHAISDLVSLAPSVHSALDNGDEAWGPLFGSVGLAADPADHLIDFGRPHRRKEAVSDPRRKYRIAAIAGAACLVALLIVGTMIGRRSAELGRLESELRALSTNSEARDLLIGRVETIDRWKRGDINWLDELYEISARFPLPDEAIVTQFSTSVGGAIEEGAINLGGMISEPRVENAMVQELRDRPYNVTQGKTIPLEETSTYSRSFDVRLTLPFGQRNVDQLVRPAARTKPDSTTPADSAEPTNDEVSPSSTESSPQ